MPPQSPEDVLANPETQRLSPTGIRVVIAGAGIGGLWTALECWRKGHEVSILERAPEAPVNGDFLSINFAAAKAFNSWPIMKAEHEESPHLRLSIFRRDGTCLKPREDAKPEAAYGQASTATMALQARRTRRAALQGILLRQVSRIGLEVEYGCKVVDYDETPDQGYAVLEDGTKIGGDIVVAADGIGTKSNRLVRGAPLKARSSGNAAYRCAFPVEIMEQDPVLREHFKLLDGERGASQMWIGPGLYSIVTRNHDTFSYGVNHKENSTSEETWSSTSSSCQPGDVLRAVEQAWGACPDILKRMIEITPAESLLDFRIMWRDAHSTWTSPRGRVIQLGDAAHTLVPSSGNGANQAIEDAVSLAACLEIGGKDNVVTAARVHNLLRFERVSCCQLLGFKNQASRQNMDKEAFSGRSETMSQQIGRWIWEHDAEKYAHDSYEAAREHLEGQGGFKNTNIPPGYEYKPWDVDELLRSIADGKRIEVGGDWD